MRPRAIASSLGSSGYKREGIADLRNRSEVDLVEETTGSRR